MMSPSGCRILILKWDAGQPEVIVHIGTDDKVRKRADVMQSEYREFGQEFRKQDLKCITAGATCQ